MSEAKRIVLKYMDESEFYKNIERVAAGLPVKWKSTPSVEACIRWDNICKRHGVLK